MTQNYPDAIIVGGGVVGCAIAYELAAAGLKPVVIERDAIGSHASGFAFGELLPWWGRGIPGPLFPFARECLELHRELNPTLKEQTGIDTQFRVADAISVAFDDAAAARLLDRGQWLSGEGVSAQWLDTSEALQVEPRLSSRILGGLHLECVGLLESYKLVLALAQGAERLGAAIRHGDVQGIQREGDRATGVVLGTGTLACRHLILAAGPWSGAVGAWLGLPLPVAPLKGQILRLDIPGAPISTYLGWDDCYAVTKGDGLLWAGSTEEDAGFNERPTSEARDLILEGLVRLLPAAEEARVVRQTACLRPLSADGLPVLGRVPGWSNVYVATGTGRNGILLGPGIGRSLAQLITRGRAQFSVEPFALDRFLPGTGALDTK